MSVVSSTNISIIELLHHGCMAALAESYHSLHTCEPMGWLEM